MLYLLVIYDLLSMTGIRYSLSFSLSHYQLNNGRVSMMGGLTIQRVFYRHFRHLTSTTFWRARSWPIGLTGKGSYSISIPQMRSMCRSFFTVQKLGMHSTFYMSWLFFFAACHCMVLSQDVSQQLIVCQPRKHLAFTDIELLCCPCAGGTWGTKFLLTLPNFFCFASWGFWIIGALLPTWLQSPIKRQQIRLGQLTQVWNGVNVAWKYSTQE